MDSKTKDDLLKLYITADHRYCKRLLMNLGIFYILSNHLKIAIEEADLKGENS